MLKKYVALLILVIFLVNGSNCYVVQCVFGEFTARVDKRNATIMSIQWETDNNWIYIYGICKKK